MLKALLAFLAGKEPPHVEVYLGRNKKWYVRTVGANGEPMGQSQAYSKKANAVRAAQDRIDNSPNRYCIKEPKGTV